MSHSCCCFSWDLTETEPTVFSAQAREPLWWHTEVLQFELDAGSATAVTVSFESDDPPRFVRDLDLSNPPPPPQLCDE